MNQWPTHCARCGADLATTSSIMSKFNQDTICAACKVRERAHPDYKAADAAEVAAVRAGIYNYPGVGCPPELYHPASLAEKVVIASQGQSSNVSLQAAHKEGGIPSQGAQPGTRRLRFPDGSELQILLTDPVGCTVTTYACV